MFLDGVAPYALEPAAKAAFLLGHLQNCWYITVHTPPYANLVEDWRQHCGSARG
jgi:hypothetical protein